MVCAINNHLTPARLYINMLDMKNYAFLLIQKSTEKVIFHCDLSPY